MKRSSPTARADLLFSKLVRAAGQCAKCQKTTHLQCAHGFSRRYRNTRWDFDNAWCLCRGCHLYFTHRPLEWDEWMLEELGLPTYTDLRFRALSLEKVDVKAVLARLEKLYV
jgi:hypothetical protein